jgi:hypothetical protein
MDVGEAEHQVNAGLAGCTSIVATVAVRQMITNAK